MDSREASAFGRGDQEDGDQRHVGHHGRGDGEATAYGTAAPAYGFGSPPHRRQGRRTMLATMAEERAKHAEEMEKLRK